MNLKELKEIKISDLAANRLTYLVPKISFDGYTSDELMWIKYFEDDAAIVFRCLDGKLHKLKEAQLSFLRLVGR